MKKIQWILFFLYLPLAASYANIKTHSIGVLLPLSGNLETRGVIHQAALKIAQDDINEFFQKIHLEHRINLQIYDTETNPQTALKRLKDLKAQKVKLVVGPTDSASIEACIDFANRAKMIIISPSSTSPKLGRASDNLIRLSLNDEWQALTLAKLCQDQGITHLVSLTRDDIWGRELHNLVKEKMQGFGGLVYSNTMHSPDEKNWQPIMQTMEKLLENATYHHGMDKVAVHFIGFDEGVEIFKAASHFPLLSSVKWVGSDGFSKSSSLPQDPEALNFAKKVSYEHPIFEVAEEQAYLFEPFQQKMAEQGFYNLDIYIGNIYDALWISSLASIGQNKGNSIKSWKKALESAASHNLGITGWAILNELGDRAIGEYVTWKLTHSKGNPSQFTWEKQQRYKNNLLTQDSKYEEIALPNPSSKDHFRSPEEDIMISKKLQQPLDRIKRFSDVSTGRFYQ